jgi:Zn-dependent metalloprotease
MKTSRKGGDVKRASKRGGPHGFKSFGMHSTETGGKEAFAKLTAERSGHSAFAIETSQPAATDPETAAKRILHQALESDSVRGLTAPMVGQAESQFKSLGVTTVPLTGTNVVKFRQYVKGVQVYGSLVSVELGEDNECVSLNSNLATPDVKTSVAKISPHDALKTAADAAGYGRDLPDTTPILNYYLDTKGKWHLAYIIENVRSRKRRGGGTGKAKRTPEMMPLINDYVVDAISGAMVAELPRTPSISAASAARAIAAAVDKAMDELGNLRSFSVEASGAQKRMVDPTLHIETCDFNFGDPEQQNGKLPGAIVNPPWSPAAVSAHVNAAAVATFLREVLKRNNIDDQGGWLISTVNCVVERESPGEDVWLNAFWDQERTQMVYGQAKFNDKLRSLASALDVVAHEMFHGVTGATARLEYIGESGALNESYSDIFGILVSNFEEPDRGKWNWLIGDGISSGLSAIRDFQDPTKFGQPKHMRAYVNVKEPPSRRNDMGGVHTNSGIHNYAAYKIMTAQDPNGAFLFKTPELAAMFYVGLTQQLPRGQATFSNSRRAVVFATRSLFRTLPQAELDLRVTAVENGFKAAGIT